MIQYNQIQKQFEVNINKFYLPF